MLWARVLYKSANNRFSKSDINLSFNHGIYNWSYLGYIFYFNFDTRILNGRRIVSYIGTLAIFSWDFQWQSNNFSIYPD